MSKPTIYVAIALLMYRGKVLVGWRNADQHQGNKYEFPGGKIEAGETPVEACRREIFEEVGVGIQHWHAFDVIHHVYEDVEVFLHLFHATVSEQYLADIQKPWTWYSRDQLLELNFPKANRPIIQRLFWHHYIKISDDLTALRDSKKDTNHEKTVLPLFYYRTEFKPSVIQEIQQIDQDDLSRLIVNIDIWVQLPESLQKAVAAVHYKQQQVMDLQMGQLPLGMRCIAACHDMVSLQRAHSLGFDAVILSPVLPTATHPDAHALGWEQFAQYAKSSDLPVFALGGLSPADLSIAKQHHAYGIAGISLF
ncbi:MULTISPECIES: NUDIX domain-containing protein [unclassified Acinetobacter]|uniref:NUDIX domain-containing protein n=1 Tax=unclassified Acinetobacter TaxID=196816 RepID=UPI0018AA6A15|nr:MULTISPECIES: NUDIX domain-containing protein [unclassified Acinetobacter]MBJ9954004.1 NUDIX domain-containing protein [Acinetobacter baumannii]